MQKFIKSLFFILVGLVVVCVLVNIICIRGVKNMGYIGEETSIQRSNYMINKLEADVLIVGASKALYDYVAQDIIDSINDYCKANYSIYNMGENGRVVNIGVYRAEAVMKRKLPKLIILDTEEFEFSLQDMDKNVFHISIFSDNDIVQRCINSLPLKDRILLSKYSIYKYNNRFLGLAKSSLKSPKEKIIPQNVQGRLDTQISKENLEMNAQRKNQTDFANDTIIGQTARSFERFLQMCKDNKVQVLVVTSPRYHTIQKNIYIEKTCQKYDVPYLNMQDVDYLNKHHEYWKDASHLNYKGAEVYTKMFIQELKPYLSKIK
ncbi:MAG: hypothetical protein IJ180_11130 [Bacteroidales bacterium]|nr:hypothetical protein [Bacteroidales bacterium]